MKFYVGITDRRWYEQLQEERPDEVNFWKPGGEQGFRALSPGELFLFKLHAPQNYIVGGGAFVSFSFLPVSLAWDAFGRKNGVRDRSEFLSRIGHYRRNSLAPGEDPTIGAIILNAPFFFSREEWIPAPANWPRSTVQGKSYDVDSVEGAHLFREVQLRLKSTQRTPAVLTTHEDVRTYASRARLGQGAFRVMVTDAYERRCSVTGERTLPVLEAAHIVPYSVEQVNHTANGLLLRADLHNLFDTGLMTVTPDYRIRVSPAIRERFENGRDYYALEGREIRIPSNSEDRPDPMRLLWHEENVFVRD